MNTHTIHKIALSLILGGTLSVALNSALAAPPGLTLDIAQTPMTVSASGAIPNIMIMLDNSGSMDEKIVLLNTPITPNDKPSTYTTYSCTNKVTGGPANNPTAVNMIVSSTGTPKICTTTTCSSSTNFGSSSSNKCFDNTKYYTVKYYNGATLGTFNGLNLNWYFAPAPAAGGYFTNANSNLNASSTKQTITRMKMAKDAARNLIDAQTPATGENPSVRVGLTTFNGNTGGKLLVAMGDLDAAKATVMKNAIGNTSLDANGNVIFDSGGNGQYTGLKPSGFTPLAETLADIGRYFCTGYTGTLTLHPVGTAGTPTAKTIDQVFGTQGSTSGDFTTNNDGLTNSTSPLVNPLPNPIQHYCQKSAVILITDGLPNKDREVSNALRDYSNDCGKTPSLCVATPTSEGSSDLPGSVLTGSSGNCADNKYNVACKNGTKKGREYEAFGSDYLDDVAQGLYEMDLRPSWPGVTKPNGSKNNLKVYAVGISDTKLQAGSEDKDGDNILDAGEDTNGNGILDIGSVLRDAAIRGGGTFEYADDYNKLVEALDKMVEDIKKGVGSFSAIAANSTQLGADTALFQAKYDTTDWTGDFIALPLTPSEDKNGNGQLDADEDTVIINNKLDTGGEVKAPVWNAGMKIPAWDTSTKTSPRNIYTYNPSATTKGVGFKDLTAKQICDQLTTNQKNALNPDAGATNCNDPNDIGLWRIDYLRGDFSHEQVSETNKAAYTSTNPDPRAGNTQQVFRNRARFYNEGTLTATPLVGDTVTHTVGELKKPDPWLLGDIVDSDGVYVSNENYGYTKLADADGGGTKYNTFLTSKSSWRKMVYVGANDGLLHGFDARISSTDTEAGKEIIAYMPNTVFDVNGNLKNFSSPSYTHQYFVDGSPRVSDVYWGTGVGASWHTVLVGTTGAGGRGIFALDVSDPSTFSASDVLWEVNTLEGPKTTDITTDTAGFAGLRGFANNLGYTLPQASIGRMNNGRFAAIVANGYNSANKIGVLYVIEIDTGEIIKAFDTQVVSSGLSAPFAADVDRNGTIDAIYAGDLFGNMWKFDVSSPTVSKWKIAYGTDGSPAPLFTACSDRSSLDNCDLTRQSITSKPQVGKAGLAQTGGVMVYFGTGKYFEDSDNNVANTQTQSFYGIWDNCPLVSDPDITTHSCPATTGITVAGVQNSSPPLIKQSITAEIAASTAIPVDVRVTSNNPISYPTDKGWYMDFIHPTTSANRGERIISTPLLIANRIVFVTFIPIVTTTQTADVCKSGVNSESWLMELDALTGARPSVEVLDINRNGVIDSSDVVSAAAANTSASVPASATKQGSGMVKAPTLMKNGNQIDKFGSYTTGDIGKEKNPNDDTSNKGAGRQSWRQL